MNGAGPWNRSIHAGGDTRGPIFQAALFFARQMDNSRSRSGGLGVDKGQLPAKTVAREGTVLSIRLSVDQGFPVC